jgi:hypothetical protein
MNYLLASATSFVLAVVYAVLQTLPGLRVAVTDIVWILVVGWCTILAYRILKRWTTRGSYGRVYQGFFVAISVLFIAQIVDLVDEVFLNRPIPETSSASVFYVVGYVIAIVTLARCLWLFKGSLTGVDLVFSFLVGLLPAAAGNWFLLTPFGTQHSLDLLTDVTISTYLILGGILMMLTVSMLMIFRRGKLAVSWSWIGFGFLLIALANDVFALGLAQGWYYSGHPVELIWLWGFVSIGLGGTAQRTEWFLDSNK